MKRIILKETTNKKSLVLPKFEPKHLIIETDIKGFSKVEMIGISKIDFMTKLWSNMVIILENKTTQEIIDFINETYKTEWVFEEISNVQWTD